MFSFYNYVRVYLRCWEARLNTGSLSVTYCCRSRHAPSCQVAGAQLFCFYSRATSSSKPDKRRSFSSVGLVVRLEIPEKKFCVGSQVSQLAFWLISVFGSLSCWASWCCFLDASFTRLSFHKLILILVLPFGSRLPLCTFFINAALLSMAGCNLLSNNLDLFKL